MVPTGRMTGLILALLLLLPGPVPGGEPGPEAVGVLPEDAEAGFILRFEDLPEDLRDRKMLFRLDDEGRPTLLAGLTLIRLGEKVEMQHLPRNMRFDDFAWMRDGSLLAVSGRRLVTPASGKLETLLELPDRGMRIEPADETRLYLHGGENRQTRLDLHVYRKGGGLIHLAEMPYPITAVSGDGDTAFVAVGRSILIATPGKPVSLVFRPRYEVTSLAMAPPWGLFYATHRNVGFVGRAGQGFSFLETKNAQVHARDKTLYILIPHQGILRAGPIEAFADMAKELGE